MKIKKRHKRHIRLVAFLGVVLFFLLGVIFDLGIPFIITFAVATVVAATVLFFKDIL